MEGVYVYIVVRPMIKLNASGTKTQEDMLVPLGAMACTSGIPARFFKLCA
jgi:hypothetical protein